MTVSRYSTRCWGNHPTCFEEVSPEKVFRDIPNLVWALGLDRLIVYYCSAIRKSGWLIVTHRILMNVLTERYRENALWITSTRFSEFSFR